MKPQLVPLWVCLCLSNAVGFAMAAYIGATGHVPQDAAMDGALAVVCMMAPGIVAKATKNRPKQAAVPVACSAMRVLGRHDGKPCASCEMEGAKLFRRGA